MEFIEKKKNRLFCKQWIAFHIFPLDRGLRNRCRRKRRFNAFTVDSALPLARLSRDKAGKGGNYIVRRVTTQPFSRATDRSLARMAFKFLRDDEDAYIMHSVRPASGTSLLRR